MTINISLHSISNPKYHPKNKKDTPGLIFVYCKDNPISEDSKIICACIKPREIRLSKIIEKFGADYATFSPIFLTPNKGKPKGIKELKETRTSM